MTIKIYDVYHKYAKLESVSDDPFDRYSDVFSTIDREKVASFSTKEAAVDYINKWSCPFVYTFLDTKNSSLNSID